MEESKQQPQSPQPVNSMPVPINNSSKSKVIPIIFGFAAVIVLAIGAYALGTKQNQTVVQNSVQPTPIPSPTPDPTTNWKTYVSKEYILEMKYPNNLSVSFSTKNGIVLEDKDNLNNGRLIIKLVDKKFEEAIRSISPIEVKNTQINKKDAVYYFLGDHNQQSKNYKIKVNENQTLEVQMISTEIGSLSLEEQSNIFDQILATFKLTDQNQTLDTSTWKTYTNTKYNYSLKYPTDWKHAECSSTVFGPDVVSTCDTDSPGILIVSTTDGINNPLISVSDEFKVIENKKIVSSTHFFKTILYESGKNCLA